MTNKALYANKQTLNILFEIWIHISDKRKFQFIILIFLNFIGSFIESFSIAITLPLINTLIDPNQVWSLLWLQKLFLKIGIDSAEKILLPITISFIIASLASMLIKLFILWANNYFAALIGNDISCEAYERTLFQSYEKHLERNSSEVISAATTYVDRTVRSIYNSLNFLSYLFYVISIQITLFIINWQIAFSALFIFVSSRSKIELLHNGKIIAHMTKERVKSIQEGLGSIRDMLLSNKQKIFVDQYSKYDFLYRNKLALNKFIIFSPKYIIENIGFIFIAILAYKSSLDVESNQKFLSIIGTFAIAAQKLLPSMQQCYNALGNIRSNKESMFEVIKMLNQEKNDKYFDDFKPLYFKDRISLSNVSFKYSSDNNFIFENINLEINKGDRVGIIGKTGSGKSTLADIIMGLLMPSKGNLIIDQNKIINKASSRDLFRWRLAISHVPQNIFLSDKTIAENIAFGIDFNNIDMYKVKKAAELAQLSKFIDSLKNKYYTKVGENGLKLSGGQRQRIGIARALYQNSQIIIFDEATSALDNKTELDVMNALGRLDKKFTIIIIAHRLSTIKKCNKLIKFLDKGIEIIEK